MVNYRSVTAVLVVVAVIFAATTGYLFVTPPAATTTTVTNTSTKLSTLLSTVSSTILNTLTSTTTSLLTSTSTLINTITTTASATLLSTTTSTATTTATSTITGPFTVNLAFKAGTGLYLTNATGFTLYFRATDSGNGTSTCTGSCVTVWPLFYAAPGTITVPPGLSVSSFGVASRTDGKLQTTYNGYPLYYYENDLVAGQVAGQGKGNFYPCCSVDQTSTTSTTTTTTTTATTTSTAVAVVKVSIPSGTGSNMNLNFSPSTIRVVIGTNNTVMWTNNDVVTHSVVSSSVPTGAQSFSNENLTPGSTYSLTFTVAGTYQYYCDIHPWMSGTITVVA